MGTLAVATCENHPRREAIGVCVQCRTRICSECSTKVEGINYCVTCLAGLAAFGGHDTGKPRVARGKGASRALLGATALLLWAGTWLLLEALLAGGV